MAYLHELDEKALIKILTEPKNALVKQYHKLFEFENVRLRFTEGALQAVGQEAIKRDSGARGLRSILEATMLDVMYDIPSQEKIKEVVITKEVVTKQEAPIIVYEEHLETA